MRELEEAVRRDLQDLLNTRRAAIDGFPEDAELSRSLLMFGLPELTGFNPTVPDHCKTIQTMIEDTIAHAPHLTSVINEDATPQDLARLALGDIDFDVLEESDVAFRCNCSIERARTLIAALGPTEVKSMLADDRGAVMSCGFCSEVYQLDEDDLKGILAAEG